MPMGRKPPCEVRLAMPPDTPGHKPRVVTSPTPRNTTIAATLIEANQYSVSPQERTDNRLSSVKRVIKPSVKRQGATPGYQ